MALSIGKVPKWVGIRPFKRHSLVLLVAGGVYVAIGWSLLLAVPSEGSKRALQYAIEVFSFDIWGGVFIFAGSLAMLSSRWPPISETWGYTVLTGLSTLWAGFYAIGIMLGESPASNARQVFTWALVAFLWWAISGLVNPEPAERIEKE